QYLRAATAFIRARALVASVERNPERWRGRLRVARRLARALERERMPWTSAFSSFVTAAVENAAGNRAEAMGALELAIDRASVADMSLFALVARHRHGLAMGGAEGAKRLRDAEEGLRAQGIAVPERFARMFLPGTWGAPVPGQ